MSMLLIAPMARTQQAAPATQAPLNVDHDPVPSPDPDVPVTAEAGTKSGAVGVVTRGAGGLFTLHEDAFEIRLNATVVDGSGHTVDSLKKDAFRVYEDNKLQTIAGFQHEDLPVSLGILIDSSGSMYDKRDAVNHASLELVKLSNPEDEAFVVDFSWEAFLDQEFTSDISKLNQGLSYIKSSGGTAIYDAILASADEMSKHAKRAKQVLVVVTDGEDNASTATLEETIQRVQDLDGPVIYCVGLLFGEDTDKNEARHAQRVLEALAQETGGLAFFPKSVREVDAIAAQVAQDIRTQYTITYHSTKPPQLGGYRQIHVLAKQKGFSRLDVRTRTGYYPHMMKQDAAAAAGLGDGAKKPQ
jgi:VWFA-related protein